MLSNFNFRYKLKKKNNKILKTKVKLISISPIWGFN